MRATTSLLALACAAAIALPAAAQPSDNGGPARLLRQPTISASQIAFMYGNDIWIVGREGGEARRVTSFAGQETNPQFSPDGRWLAFTAQYAGNTDVYVVPVTGGEPTRLTFHPAPDLVQGWTPDSRRVVFSSSRNAPPQSSNRFYTVGLDADMPEEMPMPRAHQGMISPDGRRLAYRMVSPWEDEWRNYRGGQNRPIWILDLDDLGLDEIEPWDGSNDQDPVWLGDDIYFMSDRDLAMNIYAYSPATKQLRQLTHFVDWDVKSLDAGGGVLAFEQGGWIHTLDPTTGETNRVDITVRGDFPWLMPQWENVGNRIANAAISPTGRRAIFEARGDIFTVPATAGDGDWRNLTSSPGVADRNPTWSPKGDHVAWFSDAEGEYALVIADQQGIENRRSIPLESETFYFTPAWSPDGTRILFTDTDLNLWIVDVESGRQTKADTDAYMVPARTMDPAWSPDSKWVAYAKRLDNQLHVIMLYDVEAERTHQVTDGMADALSPAWDASGKYLWFLASTNFGLNTGWLEMSSYERPVTYGLYFAILSDTAKSPLLPKTGDESGTPTTARAGASGDSARAPAQQTPTVEVDLDGIQGRVVAVQAVPLRPYSGLVSGVAGTVFYGESVQNQQGQTLHRYQLSERETGVFMTGVNSWEVSADRKKLLYRAGPNWGIVDADRQPPQAGAGRLATNDLRMRIDPRAEFAQMAREGWRYQRDFLYVPNTHGADWDAIWTQYSPLVEHVAHRSDLTYLLDWMGGEIAIGHSFVRGGALPDIPEMNVGLLGADLEADRGRYRIARIYDGESWNPNLRGPLAAPGLGVGVGDYILEVNGVEIVAPANPYRAFEGTANRQVLLRVNDSPTLEGSRVVTVVPVANENALRQIAWVEDNRRKVDALSNGRLAYVWVPNTGQGGYTYFNRWYFAQQDRPGAIIDERFNSGGSAADYIVDILARELHGYFNNPVAERRPFTTPQAGIWGPKVMIINEMAGSGGDLMPYMFRRMEIGPLVGKRTWGGLVGTWDTPPLLDGGSMIAPRGGFFDLDGEWSVENEGVAPDIEVEMTTREFAAGGDPQLERAVAEALRLLEQNPVVLKPEPPPPVRWARPRGR
jgi:tricorn protease